MAVIKLDPYVRLKSRIQKELPVKKLIGDIVIDDEEYKILIDYLKNHYRRIISSTPEPNPVLAVALVQIGIRYYDGSYWPHVAHELGLSSFPANQQICFGDVFYKTLLHYDKLRLDWGEYVKNILMQGFVSDHYSGALFNFLFAFYRIDLERDITRLDRTMVNDLFDVMVRNDNTGRTYWLVQQTADAIRANPKGTKIRIRRLMRLIDKCFWDQIVPTNAANRLTQNFVRWQAESDVFQIDMSEHHGGYEHGRGAKNFSTPYILSDLLNMNFSLVLPKQLVKFDYMGSLVWNITHDGKTERVTVESYQGVTGLKTEELSVPISPDSLFSEYDIELYSGETRLKRFNIKNDCARFFAKDGTFIQPSSLPTGEVYAFTRLGDEILSEGCCNSERRGALTLYYFDFQLGDIIRLPDGKPLSIGRKLEDGILPRGRVSGACALLNGDRVSIYKQSPTMLIKMPPSRTAGTVIMVNAKQYRFSDEQAVKIDLNDRTGEAGYIIRLSDYGCAKDGMYEVLIDVPNDRTERRERFALLQSFQYEFEGAPYIFSSRGTIRFPNALNIVSDDPASQKLKGENVFNFEIDPIKDDVSYSLKANNEDITINMSVPVFRWKFAEGTWEISQPSEIWHSDFPKMIYIKYFGDQLSLSLDDDDVFEDDTDQYQIFNKIKEKQQFECDMTRFKTWLGRTKEVRTLYLDFKDDRKEFFQISTKSRISSCLIRGDYEKDLIICEFDIVGNSRYLADIAFGDRLIIEKAEILDGKAELSMEIGSGRYTVIVYEQDDDDTGFGEPVYLPLAKYEKEILNPYDLTGKSLIIEHIRKNEDSLFKEPLSGRFIVNDLKREDPDDKHGYTGQMSIEIQGEYVAQFDVAVVFNDLEKLKFAHISFIEDGDTTEFLYEDVRKLLVKYEDLRLYRSERYRRYRPIYDDDYVYVVSFIETPGTPQKINANSAHRRFFYEQDTTEAPNISQTSIWKASTNAPAKTLTALQTPAYSGITIERLDLSPRAYNCLKRAGIRTADAILALPPGGFSRIRNLGRKSAEEIISKLGRVGINLDRDEVIRGFSLDQTNENQKHDKNADIPGAPDEAEGPSSSYEPGEGLAASYEPDEGLAASYEPDECLASSYEPGPVSVKELGLHPMVYNCLIDAGYDTLDDLIALIVQKGIRGLDNISRLTADRRSELIDSLQKQGIKF